MPFTARIEEIFEEKVIDNTMDLVANNMQSALDYFYGAATYPAFVERTLGNFVRLTWPAYALQPDRGTSVESEHYDEKKIRLIHNFAVVDSVAPDAYRKAIKYLRALRSLLRNGTTAEYLADTGSNRVMSIAHSFEWEYGEPAKNPNVANEWMMAVSLVHTLEFNER